MRRQGRAFRTVGQISAAPSCRGIRGRVAGWTRC
jgi:hypothetical protein